MKRRDRIYYKYNGKCAYSGTPLEDDWEIDHVNPVIRSPLSGEMLSEKDDNEDNMVPCQKAINRYKGSLGLQEFRDWFIGELHLRLKKLPKNPRKPHTKAKKKRMLKIAGYFGITEDKPFNGKFYFEGVIVEAPDKFTDFIALSYNHEMSNEYKVQARRTKRGKMYMLEVSHYQIEKVMKQYGTK